MRSAVRDGFYDWSKRYEGEVRTAYQDVKGLVSIGVGILADPPGLMLSLPFRRSDGTLATPGEIRGEYDRIKALGKGRIEDGNPAALGGWTYARPHCALHLDDEGMHYVVERKIASNEVVLRTRFPNWDEFCADAQLGIMSYAWAIGASFGAIAPKLTQAIRTLDWLTASVESHIQEKGNPGVIPRNRAMVTLFRNADFVDTHDLDPDVLYWPRDLATELPPDAA